MKYEKTFGREVSNYPVCNLNFSNVCQKKKAKSNPNFHISTYPSSQCMTLV